MRVAFDDPAVYLAEIQRLDAKGQRRACAGDEAQLHGIRQHAPSVARRLSREVSAGGYAFAPLRPHLAMINGKSRLLYRAEPLDAIVWAVLARTIQSVVDGRLDPHVHSYRSGGSQWTAARAFGRYLDAHQAQRRDPRTRGVFVLRRDVRSYGESIDASADSSLWTTLNELFAGSPLAQVGPTARLVRSAFAPDVLQPEGGARPLSRGVPTGIPTQPIACNAYLLPVDRRLVAIEGAFYARFGDDIVFAHPDAEVTRQAARTLDHGLSELGLGFSEHKSRDYYLTGVGRAHALEKDFLPVRCLPYLGLGVGFAGVQLRSDKRRALWRELDRRIHRVSTQLQTRDLEVRARALCAVVRDTLDVRSPLAQRYAGWLRSAALCRRDLVELDDLIALRVAEKLSGKRGVRAFRVVPPRRLRHEFGLLSLVRAWDDARRQRRAE